MSSATHLLDQGHFRAAPSAPNKADRQIAKKSEATTLFFVCSFAIHAGLLIVFSSLPGPAHAKASSSQEIEVALLQDTPTDSTPAAPEPEAMPLGELTEAPVLRSAQAPTQQPPLSHQPALSNQLAPSENLAASAAPAVLTSNNPYESSNIAAFTAGRASEPTSRVVTSTPAPAASSAFGVRSGSEDFSEEKAKALEAWYRKVRAQLANLASRSYPKRAQHQRLEGTPKIAFHVDSTGRVLSASIHEGSGHAILDRDALVKAQAVGSFDAFPAGTGPIHFIAPLTYRLH
jgi:TonB family protein